MIFLDSQYPQPDVAQSECRKETLYAAITRRVVPLERQYCQLLSSQHAKLCQLSLDPGLEQDQRRELSSWITELQRMIKSHSVGNNEPLTLQKTASCDTALWMLFGSNDAEKIGENIDNYCHRRSKQIEKIHQQLLKINSLPSLKQQLKNRQRSEPHIARFLDESPRGYSN